MVAETAEEPGEATEVGVMEEARETEGWEAEATAEETAEETATVGMVGVAMVGLAAAMEEAMVGCAAHTWTRCTGGSAHSVTSLPHARTDMARVNSSPIDTLEPGMHTSM